VDEYQLILENKVEEMNRLEEQYEESKEVTLFFQGQFNVTCILNFSFRMIAK
jgi:hypothetical protein